MAEFDLEKIKIGDDVYKIAAGGGNGPTVRTMHWEYGTYGVLLVADAPWNDVKVGDIVAISALNKDDQYLGDTKYTNVLASPFTLDLGVLDMVQLTFNDELLQAWENTSAYEPNSSYNIISVRHDMMCIITGIYEDSAASSWSVKYKYTLRPISKCQASPFGIGDKLYVAPDMSMITDYEKHQIEDSVVNAYSLLSGTRFDSGDNVYPGVTCKDRNFTVLPNGGIGKYYLGNGYYLEAMYFGNIDSVKGLTHFDFYDSTNSGRSANILGFYGCKDTSTDKRMTFYDTYFVKGDTQVKNGYYPTYPEALSNSTCSCIYVVYRH